MEVAGAVVQGTQLVTIVLAPLLVGLLALVLKRSGIGLTVRALEQNREHAQLLGIAPRRVYLFVVMAAVVLATVAGALLGSMQFISPGMGSDPLLRAFVVLAFGGAGSLAGTIAGAYAIGLLEAVTTYYFGLSWSPGPGLPRDDRHHAGQAGGAAAHPGEERVNVMPKLRGLVGWPVYAIILVALPLVFTDPHSRLLLILITMYAVLALSWNLTLGFAGIFNFAQIGFFGIGAYTTAILVTRTGVDPLAGHPRLGGVGHAGLAGGVPAGAAAARHLRRPGHVRVLPALHLPGARPGRADRRLQRHRRHPRLTLGDLNLRADGRIGYYFLGAALLFAVTVLVRTLTRSTLGMSLVALRDNEPLATSRGVSRVRQHLIVFVIGAGVAGVAGSFNAYLNGVVSTDIFGFGQLTLLLSMIFLGGSGSVYGPIAGAVVVTLGLRRPPGRGRRRDVVVALLILVVLWLAPKGLAGIARSLFDSVRERLRRPGEPAPPSVTTSSTTVKETS